MAKYNITTERKEKTAAYRNTVSSKLLDNLKEQIVRILYTEQKYRDQTYSARKLAEELGTNPRYISAAVNVRFDMNYSTLVNKYRVEEAMQILADQNCDHLRIEEVSARVGFANRQSFYAAFFKFTGLTPREFKLRCKSGQQDQAFKMPEAKIS